MKEFRWGPGCGTAVPADFGPSVAAIGNFDGVHAGHREILRRVAAAAGETGATPAVLTFDPHPARVLAPERAPKLIMTLPQRLRALESEGIGAVLVIAFSPDFAKFTPEDFVERILAGMLHVRRVIVGEDFRFGHKQSGNIETLRDLGRRFGFDVQTVDAIARDGDRISSTRIRELIGRGRISKANRLLCAPFALEGAVVRGEGIGSKKTVPTLNLAPDNELMPGTGVYVTRTRDQAARAGGSGEAKWRSITNVGYRPTFEGKALTVETFLLDPPPEQAPARIEVSFLARVREERLFESPESLRAQILRDAAAAGRFHRRMERLAWDNRVSRSSKGDYR